MYINYESYLLYVTFESQVKKIDLLIVRYVIAGVFVPSPFCVGRGRETEKSFIFKSFCWNGRRIGGSVDNAFPHFSFCFSPSSLSPLSIPSPSAAKPTN